MISKKLHAGWLWKADNKELILHVGDERWAYVLRNNALLTGDTEDGKTSLIKALLVDLMTEYSPKDFGFVYIGLKERVKDIKRSPHVISVVDYSSEDLVRYALATAQYAAIDATMKHNGKHILVVVDEFSNIPIEFSMWKTIVDDMTARGVHFLFAVQAKEKAAVDALLNITTFGLRISLRSPGEAIYYQGNIIFIDYVDVRDVRSDQMERFRFSNVDHLDLNKFVKKLLWKAHGYTNASRF